MVKTNSYTDDLALCKRLLKGDERAFTEFFELYYLRAYRYCRRRVDSNHAEEVAMTAIEQAMRRIETYRGEASLLTWVYQVTRSQLSAWAKRELKHQHVDMHTPEGGLVAEVEFLMSEAPDFADADSNRGLVQLVLDYLPEIYARMLEAKYIEGLSVEEIAISQSTTATAVQSKLARARSAFKEHYYKLTSTSNVVPMLARRKQS